MSYLANASELYKYLDQVFPPHLSSKWDNDGAMCISDPEREIKKVLITLDITSSAVDYAYSNGFDAIISHHPLIFSPLKSINGSDIKSKVITKLMRNGISAFSFHTRLDAVDGGVNDILSSLLGIKNTEKLLFENEEIARIGIIDKTTPKDLAEKVKLTLSADAVSYTEGKGIVERVVVVGGAGKDFFDAAIDLFADAIITGEASYNATIDANDSGLSVICAGHFFTENPVLSFIEKTVCEFDSNIITEKFQSNSIKTI